MAGERRRRGGDGPRERPRERLRERDAKLRQHPKPPRGSGRGRMVPALTAAALALGWRRGRPGGSGGAKRPASSPPTPRPPPSPWLHRASASPTYFWGARGARPGPLPTSGAHGGSLRSRGETHGGDWSWRVTVKMEVRAPCTCGATPSTTRPTGAAPF
uniref:Mannosyl-oligosaccharide glucosidase n=1 Tax=Taeniopygia guttata TaxID=59729 RepID=A0A674GHP1_TAEGU